MLKPHSYTDEQLVQIAQNGDDDACNELLKRYTSKIQQIIYFGILDQGHVNDLTQEVLLKIYRHLPSFKANSQFSTWMYRITQNTIKNHFRTNNLRSESESQFVAEQRESSNLYESPEHLLVILEFNKQVERAIDKLSNDLRACYGLHTFEGRTYEDIAKQMNCPIGTVRSRIF
ncbi:MAG: sigma-70 family RNA polymerase sigma factor, partial [Legionella sp.]